MHSAAGIRRPKRFQYQVSIRSAAANAAINDRAVRADDALFYGAADRARRNNDARCNDNPTDARSANATGGGDHAAAGANDAFLHDTAGNLLDMIRHRDSRRGPIRA